MQGVFLVAAELAERGFIVSMTSRSAYGADLLVADQECKNTWSVQVKTNGSSNSYWLVNKQAKEHVSPHHVYVFVNLKARSGREYFIVPSANVAECVEMDHTTSGDWYSYSLSDAQQHLNSWGVFASPDHVLLD